MSSGLLRCGIVGLGRQGVRHLEACGRLADRLEVCALCDTDQGAVDRAAVQWPEADRHTDWREMLSDTAPDLLCVATNGPSHAEIVTAAAEAGVGRILCEKPIATSVADARRMTATCRANGVRISISHGRRWTRDFRWLRDRLAEGLIGPLCHMSAVCGGGLFAGVGIHLADLARMLSGAEATVAVGVVDADGRANPRGAQFRDPGGFGVWIFDNGMRFVLDLREDLGVPDSVHIYGAVGCVSIRQIEGRCSIRARSEDDRERPLTDYGRPLVDCTYGPEKLDMVAMLAGALMELLGEGPLSCTCEDGAAALSMIMAAHASAQTGMQPISLPLQPPWDALSIPFT